MDEAAQKYFPQSADKIKNLKTIDGQELLEQLVQYERHIRQE